MNNIKRSSHVNLHFVSNKTYSILQNRSVVLKLFFHVPPKYYSASLCTTYLWRCHADERELCCVLRSYFVLYIIMPWSCTTPKCSTCHQWYAYHSLKTAEIYEVLWSYWLRPPSSYILSYVARMEFEVGQPWLNLIKGKCPIRCTTSIKSYYRISLAF
jgi:hypothetical protein